MRWSSDELARGEVTVKPLRDAGAEQRMVPLASLASLAAEWLKPQAPLAAQAHLAQPGEGAQHRPKP